MGKVYTVKDLLFGSRHIYLENEKFMSSLKNLSIYDDTSTHDYYFKLINDGNNPEIRLEIIYRLLNHLRNTCNNDYFKCYLDDNKSVTFDTNIDLFTSTYDLVEWQMIAKNILNSDFANKMNFGTLYGIGNINVFDVFSDQICIRNTALRHYFHLIYHARTDSISAICYPKYSIDEESIRYVLDTPIDDNNLSSYHKEMIDNNISINKQIKYLSQADNRNCLEIRIDEDDNNIILTGVKVKKKMINNK